MQHIVVEMFGEKKTVTIEQLRDLIRKNFVSSNAKVSVDGVVCRICDIYNQLENGASMLTPSFASESKPFGRPTPSSPQKTQTTHRDNNQSFEPLADKRDEKISPSSSFPPPPSTHQKRRSKKVGYKIFSIGIALLILIGTIKLLSTKEAPDHHNRLTKYQQTTPSEKSKSERSMKTNVKSNNPFALSPNYDQHTDFKTDKNEFNNKSIKPVVLFNSEQAQEENNRFKEYDKEEYNNDDDDEEEEDDDDDDDTLQEPMEFLKASAFFDTESEDDTTPESQMNMEIPGLPPIQVTEAHKSVDPLLVVDHDKIFTEFFSNDAGKDKIPSIVTINSNNQLEQTLNRLEGKSRTVVLMPNPAPYELKKTTMIEGVITIKGESGDPADVTILVVPESTPRSGALEVSGGKLTLEGVTIRRNAPCSEEYALIAVDSKGKVSAKSCVFDASDVKGGRGVSVNGNDSSALLEDVSFKGFDDGVYAFNSSTLTVSNGCAFEENARGATVANGAELNVSDSSFIRNKIGVQVKTDGTGSLAQSTFENNDVPCEVDSYSEKKFKRTNNIGLD